jgi:hypothetical protein
MKKIRVTSFLVLGLIISVKAQNLAKNVIGLRLGSNWFWQRTLLSKKINDL